MVQVSAEASIGPGLPTNCAGLDIGPDMQREGAVGLGSGVDQPVLDHQPRAAIALLAGLEHELDGAGEFVAMPMQQMHRLDQHRGMGSRGRRHACGRESRSHSRARSPPASAARPCRRASRIVRPDPAWRRVNVDDEAGGRRPAGDTDIEAFQPIEHRPVVSGKSSPSSGSG